MLDKVAADAAETVTYSAIDAIDWNDILAFEAGVSGYDVTDAAFVMSPAARAALKGIEKAQGTAQFLCDGENHINGYAANVSGCVSNNNIYYGAWERLICGIFGDGLEIVVDNYTLAETGDVRVIATLCADAVIDAPEAFVVGKVQE
jgi:HK97 family phage major capsid protein